MGQATLDKRFGRITQLSSYPWVHFTESETEVRGGQALCCGFWQREIPSGIPRSAARLLVCGAASAFRPAPPRPAVRACPASARVREAVPPHRGPRVSAAPRGRSVRAPRPARGRSAAAAAAAAVAKVRLRKRGEAGGWDEEAERRRALRGRADAMGRLHCTQDPVPEAVGGDMQQLNQLGAQVGRAAGARAGVGPEG